MCQQALLSAVSADGSGTTSEDRSTMTPSGSSIAAEMIALRSDK
jgi:hypothetical protein